MVESRLENRAIVALIILAAVLAAGLTATIQSQLTGPPTIQTVVTTTTETTTQSITTTETQTSTVTETVTRTSTVQPHKPPTVSLVSAKKAASWSRTRLGVLVLTEEIQGIRPDLQVVDAVREAVDQWKRAVTQFTEEHPEYSYLENLALTVYVQGVNDTLLRRDPEITIRFVGNLSTALLIGETQLLVTNADTIG